MCRVFIHYYMFVIICENKKHDKKQLTGIFILNVLFFLAVFFSSLFLESIAVLPIPPKTINCVFLQRFSYIQQLIKHCFNASHAKLSSSSLSVSEEQTLALSVFKTWTRVNRKGKEMPSGSLCVSIGARAVYIMHDSYKNRAASACQSNDGGRRRAGLECVFYYYGYKMLQWWCEHP